MPRRRGHARRREEASLGRESPRDALTCATRRRGKERGDLTTMRGGRGGRGGRVGPSRGRDVERGGSRGGAGTAADDVDARSSAGGGSRARIRRANDRARASEELPASTVTSEDSSRYYSYADATKVRPVSSGPGSRSSSSHLGGTPLGLAMADDEWSALDEELEKALSGKKGRGKGGRGGDRGGSDHGSGRAGHPPVRRDAPAPPHAPRRVERAGRGAQSSSAAARDPTKTAGTTARGPDVRTNRSNTTIVNNNNNVNINTNHTVSFRTKPLGSSLLLRPPSRRARREARRPRRAFRRAPAAPRRRRRLSPRGDPRAAAARRRHLLRRRPPPPSHPPLGRHVVGTCRLMCPPRAPLARVGARD